LIEELAMLKLLMLGVCLTVSAAAFAADSDKPQGKSTPRIVDRTCSQPTGTRIPLKGKECSSIVGRVYTKEDIDRTGATTAGEALRKLDPIVR
jgi:hypothetical protein